METSNSGTKKFFCRYAVPVLDEKYLSSLKVENNNLIEFYVDNWIASTRANPDILLNKTLALKIITSRQPKFADCKYQPKEQLELIEKIYPLSHYFDFDIYHEKSILNEFSRKYGNDKLIVSFHDYQGTPPPQELNELIVLMSGFKPNVLKIATTCNSEHELDTLLQIATNLKQANQKFVLSPMGPLGKKGRLLLSMLGDSDCGMQWIYCTTDMIQSTADGQLTVEEYLEYQKFIATML